MAHGLLIAIFLHNDTQDGKSDIDRFFGRFQHLIAKYVAEGKFYIFYLYLTMKFK